MVQTGKTALLISCSDHYHHRLRVVDLCLQQRGYQTTYITSDFDHIRKQPFTCEVPGCVQLRTKPYKKNLSVARILSHRRFARDTFRYIEKENLQPDVIVALLPPNFVGHYAAEYKKKHPQVKLIFDIFDMWPETFPGGLVKKLLAPAFGVWAYVRNHSLPKADFVMTECELFRRLLKLTEERSKIVPLCSKALDISPEDIVLSDKQLDLCYLGSINNVVSIPDICDLIGRLTPKKPVTLHIIGTGEQEQALIDGAKAAGANVQFYGPIFETKRKLEIMNRCHFGLNLMRTSVCIGLTMKSVDYFRHDLPIINNVPADTERLVKENGIGVAFDDRCAETLCSLTVDQCLEMRQKVRQTFARYFDRKVVMQQIDGILDQMDL